MTAIPVTLDLQPVIDRAFQSLTYPESHLYISDFAFSNIYLFRKAHNYHFISGKWPGLSGRTYDGQRHFLPLFDITTAPNKALTNLIFTHGCVYPVSTSHLASIKNLNLVTSAALADSDYLYRAESFLNYPGRGLAKKRNLVRQFLASHDPVAVAFDTALADPAREVLRAWMAQKGKVEGEADYYPCLEAINHFARFALSGFVYFVRKVPVGFVLMQELRPTVFAVRFAKALDSYIGIYPFMFQHSCRNATSEIRWLNFEQDMNIDGVRRSKMSYCPDIISPKWRISSSM